jgi:hypothetical protein
LRQQLIVLSVADPSAATRIRLDKVICRTGSMV